MDPRGVIHALAARLRSERGQTLAEYSVVLGVITLTAVGVLTGAFPGAIVRAIQRVAELYPS